MKKETQKRVIKSKKTKFDIEREMVEIKESLKNFATKDDLKNFATKDDLKNFATKDDLKNFATKDDLKNFTSDIVLVIETFNARSIAVNDDLRYDNKQKLENHEARILKLEKSIISGKTS